MQRTKHRLDRALVQYVTEDQLQQLNMSTYDTMREMLLNSAEIASVLVSKPSPISQKTHDLFRKRHELQHWPGTRSNRVEFSLVNRVLRESLEQDIRVKHHNRVKETLKEGRSIKRAMRENTTTKNSTERQEW